MTRKPIGLSVPHRKVGCVQHDCAQCRPLTVQMIIDIADKFDWSKDCAVKFARAIEAAHGIGKAA